MDKNKNKNKNYSKMYSKEDAEPVVEVNTINEIPVVENEALVGPVGEIGVPGPAPIFGIVSGCKKLNVRTEPNPNAEVAYVVSADTKFEIDLDKSTLEWYHVSNAAGIEGYCMNDYIIVEE